MRKLLLLCLVFLAVAGFSQPYNNSWIDYSKTYYKFKIGSTGLYRIPQSALSSIGLANTPAEQFQVWRNGEQVRVYTSATTGPLGASGYIEFWGEMNDGKKDSKLYRNPDYQLSDHWSLETDTAAYFLTVNPSGVNLRFTNAANNVADNILPEEPYFMNIRGAYFKDVLNPGYNINVGLNVYSSSYDIGEGYTSNDIFPGFDLARILDSLNLYSGGPAGAFKITAVGNAPNSRNIKVKFYNNSAVIDEPMPFYSYIKKEINVPVSAFLSPDFLLVEVGTTSTIKTDRIVVSSLEIKYPSKFNFNNRRSFYFELPATANGNYLVIDNFNYGAAAPVLMDITSGNRYTGDISTPGKVKIVLPPSADVVRKFVLVNEEASNIKPINNLIQRNFVDYNNTANQADYLIISNASLFNNGAGINYVDQYKAYRTSAAGGGFNAKVFDIDQLTDQFSFGIKKHPLAIKDFIQYAKNKFSQPPLFVFLIGKGVCYNEYRPKENNPLSEKMNLVPTFGTPASDVSLVSNYGSIVPDVPVGRLSVIDGNEISHYLEKIKEYEAAQQSSSQTVADKAWMKNIVHVIGGKDSAESFLFNFYMDQYKNIIQDTLYGGKVETFSKSSSSAVQLIASKRIEELFNEGISILGYFGHSSANTLEFNLNSPESYQNRGKYPFFNVSGCTAGNNYTYDITRLSGNPTLSEKYILANQSGSIGFLASSHLGVPPFLNNYNNELYKNIGAINYGAPIGVDIKNTIQELGGASPSLDYFTRLHLEEINLHGDPALKINPHPQPDYVVEDQLVKVSPAFISVSEKKFSLDVKMYNIGKSISDSITVEVKRTYPNGTTEVIYRNKIAAIYYSDSLRIDTIPIIATRDKGANKITITVDADNDVAEISETNNSITKEIFIYEDEIKPAYPYNYAIVTTNNQKLLASTANPFSLSKQYVMELDTTELFNSSQKITKILTSVGGLIEFDPGIVYSDSTVYYWRVAPVPSGVEYHWNFSSFIYLSNSTPGSNQSHYFQHLKSDTADISLQSNRKWKYSSVLNNILIRNGVFPTAAKDATDFMITINGSDQAKSVCGVSNIIINVFDSVSLQPWVNVLGGSEGLYGSDAVCGADRINNFQFNILDRNKRKKAMDFLDMIPDNAVVIIRNTSGTSPLSNTYAADWQADSTYFGVNNTIYHRFISQGFALVDSFYRPRSFIFIYQKNHPDFNPQFVLSEGISDKITLSKDYVTPDTLGYITSPQFGPAKAWKQMHWRGTSEESNSMDNPTVEIIGITNSGTNNVLLTVNKTMQDVDISSINASQYPFIKLKMRNLDSVTLTPYQLNYWRINYDPAAEGALAPNLFLTKKDTLDAGEKLSFGIAFKNISPSAFDSLRIKASIIDKSNVSHPIPLPKVKPLISGDTVLFKYDIDTKNYLGLNTLSVDFNPDNDQPEQFHFNNFLFLNFFVKGDNYNPVLDVTFDGVHILNKDIVSARPHIVIKLKDENKYLALNDTSLLKVQIQFPDGTLHPYTFDNDTLKFTPANLTAGENTATIDLTPSLSGDDDEYQLIVSGKDVSGNTAGDLDYRVSFRIISKAMISNLLNYPNPFTTSTAFVFTITGSQPPQNIRIQILTVTGKIVREITTNELGPLHVGRNITEFKWDGTDTYGQRLANGVYLYRVLTNLNGKSLDIYKAEDDETGKYFTKGYGKMYLMR
jgi:hypothetical protein